MREEESRLLSWGSFSLLLLVLDLCYALGEGGITTITDGRKIYVGVYPPYMREDEESRLLSWGSFLLLLLVLDLCYALGELGVTTITDGHKCQRGINEGESPPYMRGRRIPTVVVGVASPSSPCARHFGVMHSGTKGGVTITKCRIYQEGSAHHINHVR